MSFAELARQQAEIAGHEMAHQRALEVLLRRLAVAMDRQSPGLLADLAGPVPRNPGDRTDPAYDEFLEAVDQHVSLILQKANEERRQQR